MYKLLLPKSLNVYKLLDKESNDNGKYRVKD